MNYKTMATSEQQPNPLWVFFMTLLPWATLYGLIHTAIYYVFKYWSDSRDERLRKIVQEENKPLEEKIDRLMDLIYELKSSK